MTLNTNFDAYDLSDENAIIVGVSGGSDSLALLFLLKDHIARLAKRPRLVAVTVDHDLREESAEEARYVALLCQANGIEHYTRLWKGEKPVTGVPAAAREKRYHLLREAAIEAGARRIFTGHTADDQIETYLMRIGRGAVGRGLAVMAEHTRLERQFMLTRPLLAVKREDLRAYLNDRNIKWVDDPTNLDMHYERPRMRQHLKDGELSDTAIVLAQIDHAQRERLRVNSQLASHLTTCEGLITLRQDGAIEVEKSGLDGLSFEAAALLFGVATSLSSGKKHLPRPADMERILHHLHSSNEQHRRINLHGSVIERRQKHYRFWRENRSMPELVLAGGESAIWDGRYNISNNSEEDIMVRCLTVSELQEYIKEQDIKRDQFFFPSLVSMPAILRNGTIIWHSATDSASFGPQFSIARVFSLFDHVLTGHDFELEAAVRVATCAKTTN